eukprot:scaffold9773_cov131-Skeletonema_dohrnii-CCMP3373.AAC.4
MIKVFMLVGIAAVLNNLPINAQRWPTYYPTYEPTFEETENDAQGDSGPGFPTYAPTPKQTTADLTTTDAPTKGDNGPDTLAPSAAVEMITPTKSPEIALTTTTPTTTAELSCPDSLSNTIEIDSISTLSYAIVPSNPAGSNNGIFCGKLSSDNIGWIGLGISPDGLMSGSTAIIALPDDNSVLKYSLGTERSVNPMSEEQQTLRDTSILQLYGRTIMTFTKLLVEEDELPILTDGSVNFFIHARGLSNALGYHGPSDRLSFQMDFGGVDVDADVTSMPPSANNETASPTLSPSTLAPIQASKPWNDRPVITPAPTSISSNGTMSPTVASNNLTETESPTPLLGSDNETIVPIYVLPGESTTSSTNYSVSALEEFTSWHTFAESLVKQGVTSMKSNESRNFFGETRRNSEKLWRFSKVFHATSRRKIQQGVSTPGSHGFVEV